MSSDAGPSRPNYAFQSQQHMHRANEFGNNEDVTIKPMRYRQHEVPIPWDDRYAPFLKKATLLQTARMGWLDYDSRLISALQEHWRSETHTFHLPVGEMTITLDDVSCLLGMRTDGEAMCLNNKDVDWKGKVTQLLGKEIPELEFKGKGRSKILLKRTWLKNNFSDLKIDAPEQKVEQYCRAYMLALCGDVLFTEASGDCVSALPLLLLQDMSVLDRWAWGSGALAYLYRALCKGTHKKRKNMGGCIMLLQLWAWEHIAVGRPVSKDVRKELQDMANDGDEDERPTVGFLWKDCTQYADITPHRHLPTHRDQFDSLVDTQVVWTPYDAFRHILPPIVEHEKTMGLLTVPLIYFWIVEMHRPERVLRQFGYAMEAPPNCEYDKRLHDITNYRGNDWPTVHSVYLAEWEEKCLGREINIPSWRPYEPSQYDAY
ncbi:hypothetical protein LUZ60_004535 [Juncus effusus]|nr:hypothetical protein LUZ60_004535 [Juncus effusus]